MDEPNLDYAYKDYSMPPDHPLANAADVLKIELEQILNSKTLDQLNYSRKDWEGCGYFDIVIVNHPNRHLYNVLKPTREENIERIMYLLTSWILKIVYLYDAGHISLDVASVAIFDISHGCQFAGSFLNWPILEPIKENL